MARFGDFDQYLDNAGDPLAEGKLYFYESGTTTLKTTYADINNSIPNTNPVLLSAAGRQPNIFFDGVAKVILTDNDDVQIAVRDPAGETGTDFGDEWVATKIYNAVDVVLGSDGIYYRSLINGNQNNNPVTTSGSWTLLYSVEWNAGITYSTGDVVTYGSQQYQSLQNSNLNQNPASQTAYWVPLNFAWVATATYSEDQNVVGTDGILYTSLQNSNTGNDPATSPAYWVGTSAAAAASAVAAAASAAAALVSENAAAADAIATAADRVQTGLDAAATAADAIATAADRVQTGLDAAATAADVILTNADAVATAADRVQTGLDAAATSADAIATAADRVQTGLDVIATNADASSTAADAIATAADRVQTGLDVVATAADRVQTGLDVTAAAGSASAASGSASAAAASAVSAAASYDAFDDRYLGEKASDPTLDNDGNALLTGALYFNTVSNAMKVYTGSAWSAVAPVATSITVSQISDYTGTATELNYTDGVTSPIQTQLDAKAVYPEQTGNAGEFLTTDGTNPSWAEISASPTLEAIASGSLGDGDTVIINADGTVSVVSATTVESFDSGSEVDYGTSNNTNQRSITYDSVNNKIIIVYTDASSNSIAKVGTVSGLDISFGTAVTVSPPTATQSACVYDPNTQKIIISYRYNSGGYSAARVGTVSGNTISFGSVVSFDGDTTFQSMVYHAAEQKVVISYVDEANSNAGTSVVGTVSGTTISFGTPVVFNATGTSFVDSVYDPDSEKVIITYRDSSGNINALTATVSGTSISFGSIVNAGDSGNTIDQGKIAYDITAQKVVIVGRVAANGGGRVYVGTVSGTSISFSTPIYFSAVQYGYYPDIVYDSLAQKCVVVSGASVAGTANAYLITITGDTPTASAPYQFASSYIDDLKIAYDSNSQVSVVSGRNVSNGSAFVIQAAEIGTTLTSENYIGISDGAYADAATATILVDGSVSEAQTGLTAGQDYYIQGDGTLALTSAVPSVLAGTATSATNLLIRTNKVPSLTGNSGKFLTTDGTNISWGAAAGWNTTEVNLSGLTTFTVSGIPSGTKHVLISLFQIRAGGTSVYFRLGDSGGIETNDYHSFTARINGSGVSSSESGSFEFKLRGLNANHSGNAKISLADSSNYDYSFSAQTGTSLGGNNELCFSAGGKSLSSELTQVLIGCVGGSFPTEARMTISYLQVYIMFISKTLNIANGKEEVIEFTEQEILNHNKKTDEDKIVNIREKRNDLLKQSDWTQVIDAPVDQEAWATYRQALRDLPSQEGFPNEVTWPTEPVAEELVQEEPAAEIVAEVVTEEPVEEVAPE